LWDVESYRAKQELEATISNMSLSAKVRMGAEIALELATEGMMTLHGEMKARPVHTAGRAVVTGIEMGVPLGDAALKTTSGVVAACRGEFAASGSLFVAALTSAGLDLTVAGLAKKALVGSKVITQAARNVGRAFQEKYVQKMCESQFKSMKGANKTGFALHSTNRAAHQRDKAYYRQEMERPHAEDFELRGLLKRFHKDGSKVGSGSTAAALREELRTGLPVGDRFHTIKTEEGIRALNRWLESNPLARHGDRAAAENMLLDLLDAAKGLL